MQMPNKKNVKTPQQKQISTPLHVSLDRENYEDISESDVNLSGKVAPKDFARLVSCFCLCIKFPHLL